MLSVVLDAFDCTAIIWLIGEDIAVPALILISSSCSIGLVEVLLLLLYFMEIAYSLSLTAICALKFFVTVARVGRFSISFFNTATNSLVASLVGRISCGLEMDFSYFV